VNALLAENLGLDRPHGAAVSSVEANGPADKAGVKPEDVILSVDGKPVETSGELPQLIAAVRPGSSITMEVWRDKAVKKITVVVGEMKDTAKAVRTKAGGKGDDSAEPDSIARLGVSVRGLTTEEKQQLGNTTGSVVVVSAEGAAAEAGISEGDVILGVNRARINSVSELQAAIRSSGRTAALLIQTTQGNSSQTRIVTVRLGN
jgi:serine protease Do